jgi:hypothetical protein
MLTLWAASLVGGVGMALSPLGKEDGAWASVFSCVVILQITWWYLYRKASVVEYYRLLSVQAANAAREKAQETFLEPDHNESER